jgi:histone acetyltransferase (RNA polymerase elongator complex component)
MIRKYNIPIFIPEAACPSKCIYCDQKIISGHSYLPSKDFIIEEINKRLLTFKRPCEIEIAFFGGNFTGLSFEKQKFYLDIAYEYYTKDLISGIRFSTRPDFIDYHKLKFLINYPVKTIEIGAQSFDDEVLMQSFRGYDSKEIYKAAELINDFGFNLGIQLMLGLPKDNKHKDLFSFNQAIKLKAKEIRIYPTIVLKNSYLERLYYQRKYAPLEIDETINILKEIFLLADNKNVKIIKVGLQITDELKKNFVAGPLVPSLKEKALSEIWLDTFKSFNFDKTKTKTTIYTSSEELNYAIGYEAMNKKYLKEQYKIVEFKLDKSLKKREFYVLYN